jgi:hypothetical protein
VDVVASDNTPQFVAATGEIATQEVLQNGVMSNPRKFKGVPRKIANVISL